MVLLTDPSKNSRQPNHLRKYRSTERQYLFDVAFGADSSQVWFGSFDVSFDFAQRCQNSTKSPPIFSKYPDNLKKPFQSIQHPFAGGSLWTNDQAVGRKRASRLQRHCFCLRGNRFRKNLHHGRATKSTRVHGEGSQRSLWGSWQNWGRSFQSKFDYIAATYSAMQPLP